MPDLNVGDQAPDFRAQAVTRQGEKEIGLADFAGSGQSMDSGNGIPHFAYYVAKGSENRAARAFFAPEPRLTASPTTL